MSQNTDPFPTPRGALSPDGVTAAVPQTPTLDKRALVIEDSNKIGRFLDWLNDQGIHLARWTDYGPALVDDELVPISEGPNALLHRYFEIDPDAEEAELRSLLDYQRALSAEPVR